jgi:large subunit ribosomal protein L27
MAHVKAGGTTKGNRDAQGKRLGVKIFGGQYAEAGSIIVRQRGTKYYPGQGVKIGDDDTIFSLLKGIVQFSTSKGKRTVSVLAQKT